MNNDEDDEDYDEDSLEESSQFSVVTPPVKSVRDSSSTSRIPNKNIPKTLLPEHSLHISINQSSWNEYNFNTNNYEDLIRTKREVSSSFSFL